MPHAVSHNDNDDKASCASTRHLHVVSHNYGDNNKASYASGLHVHVMSHGGNKDNGNKDNEGTTIRYVHIMLRNGDDDSNNGDKDNKVVNKALCASARHTSHRAQARLAKHRCNIQLETSNIDDIW